jgi:hypothetical protein
MKLVLQTQSEGTCLHTHRLYLAETEQTKLILETFGYTNTGSESKGKGTHYTAMHVMVWMFARRYRCMSLPLSLSAAQVATARFLCFRT